MALPAQLLTKSRRDNVNSWGVPFRGKGGYNPPSMAVKRWGDYEIDFDRVLGRGGMGAVYVGRQVSVDRPAAIKVLKKELTENPDFVKRFHREAALLAKLVDTHVVQVFGAGEAEGQHFYAMEYIDGEDLSSRLRRGYKFTLEEILQVAFRVGRALAAAWRHRIVHRDIKPSNIIVTKDNAIKVMDFGLAKNPEMDYTQSEIIMGTAKYMSPEQAQGAPCDIRSDMYSLGVVLYELAAGRPPFVGDTLTSLLYQQVHKRPTPPREVNPAVPEPLEALILKLMAKSPDDRFQTPDELVSAVRDILEEVTPEEKTTLMTQIAGGPRRPSTKMDKAQVAAARRRPWALYVGLAAGLAALGAGAYFAYDAARARAPQLQKVPDAPPETTPVTASIPAPEPAPVAPAPQPEAPEIPPWAEAKSRGLEAFAAGRWVEAYTNLELARDLGASDVDDKIRHARARDLLDRGDSQPDDEKALEHYEQARKYLDDAETLRKIRSCSYRVWSRRAERHQGGDWTEAAAAWAKAAEFADESQRAPAEANRGFCETYAEAIRARVNGDWPKALDLFKNLAREPRGYADALEKEIRRAEEEVRAAAEAERAKIRKEYEELLAKVKDAVARLAWAEARSLLDRVAEPRFASLPKDEAAGVAGEVQIALAAPPGMVYVPGGEFTMGASGPLARDHEGPPGKASTEAFYIDLRETTVGEYADFLKALGDGGHHAGCAKDEPLGKSHVPDGWDSQGERPGAPVTFVDWWDAASYAAWRGKRLPTEVEWEKAAGFDPQGRRAYPWGASYRKEEGRSFLGCEAMGGGVIEWTASWFDRYTWSSVSHFDFGQKKKVLRGGVLLAEDAERDARVTRRHWYHPSYRSSKIGFRCVRDIQDRKQEER